MLDIILKRIYKELPGTIAVTVHDSIMTGILTNNIEAVRKIMIDELTFFVGFEPKIKNELNIEDKEEEEERVCVFSNQYSATNLETLN
jgi:predicted HAD superfamily phosphohydrolase YqeG